jgi:hypothetical protein
VTSDQPRAAPHNRASETPTPLNAVFRRLSDTPARPGSPGGSPPAAVAAPAAAPAPVAAEPEGSAPVGAAAAEPALTPHPAPVDARSAESLAEALRRNVAEGALARQVQGAATVSVRPLPHSPGEIRDSAQQVRADGPLGAQQVRADGPLGAQLLRAEGPLGAPQAAFRLDAVPRIDSIEPARGPASSRAIARHAGLPATNLPAVLVEPQTDQERAAQGLGDRPTIGNRRLYRRVGIEAEFEIDGVSSPLVDFSMGGFAAASAPQIEPNAVVRVSVRVSVDGVEFGTRLRARMVYSDAPRSPASFSPSSFSNEPRSGGFSNAPRSGGRFIDLTASQTTFLRYVVTRRGRSAGALGATTLLAALPRWPEHGHPAAMPLPEEPAGELTGERVRRTPWWSRWFGRLSGSRREGSE